MTPLNMARHRNSPHMEFWKMIKQGYDYFEVTHLEPKVDVCEKRYVFGGESIAQFSPAERCPAYNVSQEIAAAVSNKQRHDDILTAELISGGTPAVPITTAGDGGMEYRVTGRGTPPLQRDQNEGRQRLTGAVSCGSSSGMGWCQHSRQADGVLGGIPNGPRISWLLGGSDGELVGLPSGRTGTGEGEGCDRNGIRLSRIFLWR